MKSRSPETDNKVTEKEFLAHYKSSDFPSPLVTVDLCIFTLIKNKLHILLVKRSSHPEKNKLALPGGFINLDSDSDLQETALRKLHEKTGVKSPYLEQVETIGNKNRDPRGWSVTTLYFALVSHTELKPNNAQGDELLWLVFDDLDITSLAFDHKDLIRKSRERLKNKVSYTDIAFHVMPKKFTLSELQKGFEILMGQKLEKKSFRRRILNAGLIYELDEKNLERGRPASLYTVVSEKAHYFTRHMGKL